MKPLNPVVASKSGAVLCNTQQWKAGEFKDCQEFVAEEVPVALVYNRQPYAVMLATPDNLEDFATGFSLSEKIVPSRAEVKSVKAVHLPRGRQVNISIAHHCFERLQERRRNLAGRTGCGLCGIESIEQAFPPIAAVDPRLTPGNLSPAVIQLACTELGRDQKIHDITGAVHAAAWSDVTGHIRFLREDVGRHNALDKLIGALTDSDQKMNGGFVVITSRASSEIIQKAAMVGIGLIVAVSAPTDMAVKLADQSGITLIGFSRETRFTLYSNEWRITEPHSAASEVKS